MIKYPGLDENSKIACSTCGFLVEKIQYHDTMELILSHYALAHEKLFLHKPDLNDLYRLGAIDRVIEYD